MAESNAVEQAVSRTLRDNLGRMQHASEELNQAINDLVSACASSRPANALPSMVRAQTLAASLSAALEVLSRFVAIALQPAASAPFEQEIARATSLVTAELTAVAMQPQPVRVHPIGHSAVVTSVDSAPVDIPSAPFEQVSTAGDLSSDKVMQPVEQIPPVASVPPAVEVDSIFEREQAPDIALIMEPVIAPEAGPEIAPPKDQADFDVALLPAEEQELHRRAYRVAKVSMQDIKMLHPEDIRLGRENKDLCTRLRDDIEKAHKEYGRRFGSISAHPVDYFYDWMVEILAGGNPEALGVYPYSSPVSRH
jgi:hypothetical protein